MDRILLVDFNNVFYRSAAVHAALSFNGEATGGFYGFVSQFCSVVNQTRPTLVAAFLDKKPYLRSQLYSDYKADRKQKEFAPNLQAQRLDCFDVLKSLGVSINGQQGYEADDLIAHVVLDERYKGSKIAVLSNDTDLYQLLHNGNLTIYRKLNAPYTYDAFNEEFHGFKLPADWILYTALTGGHNGLPKFNGIGPVGAKKYIRGDLNLNLDAAQLALSKQLSVLPYNNGDGIEIDLTMSPPTGLRGVLNKLHSKGIKPTVSMVEAFENLIRLT